MEVVMRPLAVVCVLAFAPFAFSQEQRKPDPPPVVLEKAEFPKGAEVGEGYNFTATLKNNVGRVALVAVRLQLNDVIQVLAPGEEQAIFLEPDAPRKVVWRLKQVKEGELAGNIGSFLLATKQGSRKPLPPEHKSMLEREWLGTFADPKSEFNARMRIHVHPDNAVEGKILWKLLKHKDEALQKLIGKEGTEFIWGTYDPAERLLLVDGYRRDDPEKVIGLDRYRLTLAPEEQRLSGTTWNHGANDGKMSLMLIEP
jgi:hypothetical protein